MIVLLVITAQIGMKPDRERWWKNRGPPNDELRFVLYIQNYNDFDPPRCDACIIHMTPRAQCGPDRTFYSVIWPL